MPLKVPNFLSEDRETKLNGREIKQIYKFLKSKLKTKTKKKRYRFFVKKHENILEKKELDHKSDLINKYEYNKFNIINNYRPTKPENNIQVNLEEKSIFSFKDKSDDTAKKGETSTDSQEKHDDDVNKKTVQVLNIGINKEMMKSEVKHLTEMKIKENKDFEQKNDFIESVNLKMDSYEEPEDLLSLENEKRKLIGEGKIFNFNETLKLPSDSSVLSLLDSHFYDKKADLGVFDNVLDDNYFNRDKFLKKYHDLSIENATGFDFVIEEHENQVECKKIEYKFYDEDNRLL